MYESFARYHCICFLSVVENVKRWQVHDARSFLHCKMHRFMSPSLPRVLLADQLILTSLLSSAVSFRCPHPSVSIISFFLMSASFSLSSRLSNSHEHTDHTLHYYWNHSIRSDNANADIEPKTSLFRRNVSDSFVSPSSSSSSFFLLQEKRKETADIIASFIMKE